MSETVETEEKQYQLRALCAKDIFPMSKIINKIGIKEFSKAFQSEDIQKLIQSFQKDAEETAEKNTEEDAAILVGVSVAFELVTIILEKLPGCEEDIYGLLASLSGLTKAEVRDLPLDVFMELIVEVVRKEEFANFIKVVLKLFKSES